MSKINKLRLNPTNHPIPDSNKGNAITFTPSPTRQVRKYLEKSKNHLQPSEYKQGGSIILSQISGSGNQQSMRRRIEQLQQQNNEFRILAQHYHNLVDKNKQLEQQMILLLQQLQSAPQQPRKFSPHAHHYTTDSIDSHSPRAQPPQIEPFDDQQLFQENRFLRKENQRIKQLVDHSVSQAVAELQRKFMSYMTAIDEKLALLAATDKEIRGLRINKDDSSASLNSSQHLNERRSSGFSLNPKHTLPLQSLQKESNPQNSLVDIQLSMNNSDHYGKDAYQDLLATPINGSSLFKQVQLVHSQQQKIYFQQSLLEKLYLSLAIFKQNLNTFFEAKSNFDITFFMESKKHIQSQLRPILSAVNPSDSAGSNHLVSNCVPLIFDPLKSPSLWQYKSQQKRASQLYMERSYYRQIEQTQMRELEESKRKLAEVIQIMKNFNNDYRHLLERRKSSAVILHYTPDKQ